MPESLEANSPLSPMDIARVARLLWQQAGAQPGHYAEYWSKVEQALNEARHAQAVGALAETPMSTPKTNQSPEASAPAQTIEATVWGRTGWEQQILRHEAEGLQATEPACRPAPLHDR